MKDRERDPKIVESDRSCDFEKDGHTVKVCIYRLETVSKWSLEVVDVNDTSTVWDEQFPSEVAAWEEFLRTIELEGIESLADPVVRRTLN